MGSAYFANLMDDFMISLDFTKKKRNSKTMHKLAPKYMYIRWYISQYLPLEEVVAVK
jgi:hypothetical protein